MKIEHVELVRADTFKVWCRVKKTALRVVVYPSGPWLVLDDSGNELRGLDMGRGWLSESQERTIRRAVRAHKGEA